MCEPKPVFWGSGATCPFCDAGREVLSSFPVLTGAGHNGTVDINLGGAVGLQL